jgi:hypothetical protein
MGNERSPGEYYDVFRKRVIRAVSRRAQRTLMWIATTALILNLRLWEYTSAD